MVEVTVEESIQLPRIHRHPPLLRKVLEAFELLAIVLGSPVSDGLLLQEGQAMRGCFGYLVQVYFLSRPRLLRCSCWTRALGLADSDELLLTSESGSLWTLGMVLICWFPRTSKGGLVNVGDLISCKVKSGQVKQTCKADLTYQPPTTDLCWVYVLD